MARNVFVVGLDELNSAALHRLPAAQECRFHQLLTREELQHGTISVPDLLAAACRELDAFTAPIDAIVGYWDFPVSMLVPILCARYGLRATSLRSVVTCEHKYWSRLEQRKVIAEVPRFGLLDLDAAVPQLPENLDFPVWIKPVKSASSEGAFYVRDAGALAEARQIVQGHVERIGGPFEDILAMLDLPPEVAAAGGRACIAEEPARGRQFTVEGFVRHGQVTVYGVVDSVTFPGRSSFLRYQYPSTIPGTVHRRVVALSERVVTAMRLDHTTFNIEYFWDPATELVRLLEINARHSQSHALLFEMVDGTANHAHMLDLALDRQPHPPNGAGRYPVAAKWFIRRFRDGIVRQVPSAEEVRALEEELPGALITIEVHPGDRLSRSYGEDSYSYVLAQVFVGGSDEAHLQRSHERCVERLRFEIAEVPAGRS